MTGGPITESVDHVDNSGVLVATAVTLAKAHCEPKRSPISFAGSFDASPVTRALETARKHLTSTATEGAPSSKAVEWFLDNYYLVRRVARQVEDDLPRGFLLRLPQLSSARHERKIRVAELARVLVVNSRLELDLGVTRRFVNAYQQVSALTIAELWALPILLRSCVLRELLGSLAGLGIPGLSQFSRAPQEATSQQDVPAPQQPALGTSVERAIHALRAFDVVDWKAFFASTSRIEAILKTDPARVYDQMDFETCDAYRKVVENLAWETGQSEERIAECAIAMAAEHPPHDRQGHVGHYLIDEGRRGLEAQIGARPKGLRRLRRAVIARPTWSYLLPVALLAWLPSLLIGWQLALLGTPVLAVMAIGVLLTFPLSNLAVSILQWAFARLLPPRIQPKLDFSKGLPRDAKTLVAIPTLLGSERDIDSMVRQIELHYLSNPDPMLEFALLTDDIDARTVSDDETLLASAAARVEALNAKHGPAGQGPFHLLHREARWNPSEERFMGWERKRGKLEELNLLLRGRTDTSYRRHVGSPSRLTGVRFVITLDSDTQLPRGTAARMIGLLAHPLNRAVFDDTTGRVSAGYTIVQPRIEASPSTSRDTAFARLFSGDIGFDIYTHAVSELYQDLFGAGIYVGKGIYEVDSFMRSLSGRTPENTIASHDLFEGIHGRTALATDIVLFENYPSSYAAFANRMHRWVRGDWQLLPWLIRRVPSSEGARLPNRLAPIDRWKILDNLRRSLLSPALCALFLLGWVWVPLDPATLTLATAGLLFVPLIRSLALDRQRRGATLGRGLLALAFLGFEAALVLDAIARVTVRLSITRKHLLQWTSAAHTELGMTTIPMRSKLWRMMGASPLFALVCAAVVAWQRPAALPSVAPLLGLWLLAPEVARWISRPMQRGPEPLQPAQRRQLRLLARKTWRFFDAFVGPDDQWLPIDNFQERPHEQTAHRTSPTNIGLMLTATLSAYDLGYIGPLELSLRTRRAFDSIARLTRYRGHLLNWYDTKSLAPLLPRYVSTVDSGNLAGCLIALKQGLRGLPSTDVMRPAIWEGLLDSLGLLEDVVKVVGRDVAMPRHHTDPMLALVQGAVAAIDAAQASPEIAYETIRTLSDETFVELDRELLAVVGIGTLRHEPEVLHALRAASGRLKQQLRRMLSEADSLMPWLATLGEPAAQAVELPTQIRMDAIVPTVERLRVQLDRWADGLRLAGTLTAELEGSSARVDAALCRGMESARALHGELVALAEEAELEVHHMDFKLLFDSERKLFRIGYNATLDQNDPHHYDLLASEARLASYVAIVKGDVPETHWYELGRPMTEVRGAPALLSWGGSMFEYLMPELLMRSQEGTLLSQTCQLIVDAQVANARNEKEPWGISESAFAHVDAHNTYQYRSFGVPGLGFKRGLEDDRVITPYASILAVSIRPRAVVENLARLEAMGMSGPYGLYEALDFTPERSIEKRGPTVVRSYMAHHQGMLLVALGNHLSGTSMCDRFHSDAQVETGQLLLNERAPSRAPREWPVAVAVDAAPHAGRPVAPPPPAPWAAAPDPQPQAFVLSNGSLTSLLTGSGGGGLTWQGLTVTRSDPDPMRERDGRWVYVRDEESGDVWSAISGESRATFAMHQTEFHCRNQGISTHIDVAVAPADDVEVQRVTVHNESGRPRWLSITSAARPVLFDAKQAPAHPAFSSLFVRSEYLEDLDGLQFTRRPQSPKEAPAALVHRLVHAGEGVRMAGYESDRMAFFGRCGSQEAPAALARASGPLQGRVGAVLDPVMCLMAQVELKASSSATLAFVTAVASSAARAVEIAHKYGTPHAVRWVFRDAAQESPRKLQRMRVQPHAVPHIQRLFSALHFASPSRRAGTDVLTRGRPCQRRLWAHGISGDDPIVLIRVRDPHSPLAGEGLEAQRYLRACGVRFDLVLVDEQPSGYLTGGSDALREVLSQQDAESWLNQRGGMYVIARDTISDDELVHLRSAARVVLDTEVGSLATHMIDAPPRRASLPRFEGTLPEEGGQRSRACPELLFDNQQGGFSQDGREYLIRLKPGKPTPAPWCNVIANEEFGCLVSESGLGASWSLNSGENRVTPWRNDPVLDTPSEAVYLRDEETAEVWSPTPLPAGLGNETLVHHGAGYTSYETESHGLEQTLTVFVPPGDGLKVVRLQVRNTLKRHRRLTATYYAEWVLGNRREPQRAYVVSELDAEHACLLATCSWQEEFAGRVSFLSSMHDIHHFTADRTEFLGRYGLYERPEALQRWGLSGCLEPGFDPCAALQIHLELEPGETLQTHFILGQAGSREAALALVKRYRQPVVVKAAWDALEGFWNDILDRTHVKTPEPAMDLMLNRWLLYQSLSARVFGRSGFYQSSGAFGYRDQLQDVLALVHVAPERTRAHLLESARHQFEQGDVLHWWHPPSGRGVRTRCSDDLLWLPFATAEYVLATGDTAVLDELVPFLTGEPLGPGEHERYAEYGCSEASAPLFEHCRRALEKGLTEGVHGLPLMGDGDWNDGMNRVGSEGLGESVWLGFFLCETMQRFAALCAQRGDHMDAAHWRTSAAALRGNIERTAWDGEWYLRAFHDTGSAVGSSRSRECHIDSISQSWAVLSSTADAPPEQRARERTAMDAAEGRLVREPERLAMLLRPPFDGSLPDPGYIGAYPPGVRENGGQYTHAATWLGFAHAAQGNGARAERIFRILNPVLQSRNGADSQRYRVEPYVLAGDVCSCAPWKGRGGWTWYTGSAAWLWRLGIEGILGIQRDRGRLRIDPCIPPGWPGFEAWSTVGKRVVHLIVSNPEHVAKGVQLVTVDGVAVRSNVIEVDPEHSGEHEVRVLLGSGAAAPAQTTAASI